MERFLFTLGYGATALLTVAILVACWEHWSRTRRGKLRHSHPPGLPAAVRVDVDLGKLDDPMQSDQQERRDTVESAIARMARASTGNSSAWTETRPMVAAGHANPAAEPERH